MVGAFAWEIIESSILSTGLHVKLSWEWSRTGVRSTAGSSILMLVALFAGVDGDGMSCPLPAGASRWCSTAGSRFVEVQRGLAIDRFVGIEEAARAAGLARGRRSETSKGIVAVLEAAAIVA